MAPTVVLNMIVKNESNIITRLFDSVIDIINTYCICDTGSTDNTVNVIQEYFDKKGIKGKIVLEPFKNFEYNRNVALQSCIGMADYVLLLDADMQLRVNNFDKLLLNNYDHFMVFQGNDTFFYQNLRILKNNGLYSYKGVTHEYINTPPNSRCLVLSKDMFFINDIGDGGCKQNKFERDVELLREGILKEPNNDRYHFYLANSYFDLSNFEEAIDMYKKRIKLGGWQEEVWFSYYKLGFAYMNKGEIEKAFHTWLDGFQYYQDRLEGIYEIIKYYRINSKHVLSNIYYEIAKKVLDKKLNRDGYLFLQNDIYTNKIYYEYTIIAYYLGIKNVNNEVVKILNTKNNDTENLLSNFKFYENILQSKKIVDLSNFFEKEINNELIKFVSSSSCMIPNEDGYSMNLRYVNYNITFNGNYTNCEKYIITLNKYIELDDSFYIKKEKLMEINFDNRLYIGVEDVKIYRNTQDNNLLYIGTQYHKNCTIGIGAGSYDIYNNYLNGNDIVPNFINTGCEKNWVYVNYKRETHIIYSWSPLRICKINGDNELYIIEEREMPIYFSHLRGSTCGFTYNNEIWFIQHIVSHESPRYYYHIITVFDENMVILRYSAPFKFSDKPIEFCLSIIVENERVLMNYSSWDRTTQIGIYDKKYLEDSILIYK
jgi:glycosyltransferase involved in cell wall biosynthesis